MYDLINGMNKLSLSYRDSKDSKIMSSTRLGSRLKRPVNDLTVMFCMSNVGVTKLIFTYQRFYYFQYVFGVDFVSFLVKFYDEFGVSFALFTE